MKVPGHFGVRDDDLETLVVPNDLRHAKSAEDQILEQIGSCCYEPDEVFAIKLALEEALTNAVKHGNRNDPGKQISIRFYIDDNRVIIMVRDQGPGFVPEQVPDPTAEENLERPNGRGLMLMHAYMTSVQYNEAGNEVWMLKEKR